VRTLAVLSAVWQQLSLAPAANGPVTASAAPQLEQYLLLLSPLVGTLTSPEARQGLASAFVALSGLLPDLATPTRLLTGLNKRSETMIGEIDYDSSLAAYSELQTGFWMELKKNQGLPLMHQCFWDLRNPNDLALRHAAAQVTNLWHIAFVSVTHACISSPETPCPPYPPASLLICLFLCHVLHVLQPTPPTPMERCTTCLVQTRLS